MKTINGVSAYHGANDLATVLGTGLGTTSPRPEWVLLIDQFTYEFQNFFHPFVGELIGKLNLTSVAGMLDPSFLSTLWQPYLKSD
jgi:hypothetical protein